MVNLPEISRGSRPLLRYGRLGLIVVVLGLLVAAADRAAITWDLSADKRFTVSDSLRRLLRLQSDPVEVVGIWPAELEDRLVPIVGALKRMTAENPRLNWRRLDPVLNKPQLADFSRRFRADENALANLPAIWVTRADRLFCIPLTNRSRFTLQQDVGGALVALADANPPVVALVQGHGELRPGDGQDGADRIMRAWTHAGLRVETRDLSRDPIKANEVLVLLGPTAPFAPRELDLLARHLTDGGALLVLADDRVSADLAVFLRRRGVVLGGMTGSLREALRADAGLALTNATSSALPVLAGRKHCVIGQDAANPEPNLLCVEEQIQADLPFTSGARSGNRGIVSPWSTPVTVLDPARADEADAARLRAAFTTLGTPPFSALWLLHSAAQDVWPKERAAPLTVPEPAVLAKLPIQGLAWVVNYQPTAQSVQAGRGARILVWGSRDAASDAWLDQERYANALLLTQAVRWLADPTRTASTDIPEAETRQFLVDCSDNTLTWLAAALVALLPSCCIGAAILAWWERR